MATLTLKRPVSYVVLVTPAFKEEISKELQEAADQVQAQIDRMEFEAKRYLADLQRTNLSQAIALRDQIEAEKRKQEKVKEELLAKLQEVRNLPEGAEFLRGTLEGVVQVKVGDDLKQVLGQAALVVKDDIVVEIRDGRQDDS